MIYYAETNLVTIIIALILLVQMKKFTTGRETSQIMMNIMLIILVIFSVSDIIAYAARGNNLALIQASNIVYFMGMALGSFAWFLYISVKTRPIRRLTQYILLTGIPVVMLSLAILTNPLTGFIFTVDSDLLYHRGDGVLVTWFVEWGYVIAALVLNILAIRTEKRSFRKSEYKGYLIFVLPMTAAAICQMLFYGTTVTQVGFMVSMLLAYINRQFYQVQRDDLTGLNNKNAFLNFRDSVTNRTRPVELTMFMMDVDNFKSINDNYGHMTGDQALCDAADILRAAVSSQQGSTSLYRYGGDEFIIVGTDLQEDDIQRICDSIAAETVEMNRKNTENKEAYRLGFSIGHANKACKDAGEFDALLSLADEAMYKVKKARKVGR